MSVVLEHWQVAALAGDPVVIYPDGCRDVIWWQSPGQAPGWRVTPLDLSARHLQGFAGAQMQGFRLQPGAVVHADLLAVLRADCPDEAASVIPHMAAVPANLAEVFAVCTAEPLPNAASLARRLGVTLRSLQRLTAATTGQGPLYWLRLSRLRCALGLAQKNLALSEVAYAAGFADQAHFSREARAFYGESPARLLTKPGAMRAILAPGFGSMPGA
jgi:AraC-like DNA-binding protein